MWWRELLWLCSEFLPFCWSWQSPQVSLPRLVVLHHKQGHRHPCHPDSSHYCSQTSPAGSRTQGSTPMRWRERGQEGKNKQKKLKIKSKTDLYRDIGNRELICTCKNTNVFNIACFEVQLIKMLAMFQAAMENDPRRPVKDHQSTFKNTRRVWEWGKRMKMGEGENTKQTWEMTENFINVWSELMDGSAVFVEVREAGLVLLCLEVKLEFWFSNHESKW